MTHVTIIQGNGPIILGQPHSGSYIPEDIAGNLNDLGRRLIDTDWHVPNLYDGLLDGVTIIRANFHRYVIDANRDPEGKSLYPGQNTTELVPTTTFDGKPIWHATPTQEDIAQRRDEFHRPYHDALKAEIDRVKAQHGLAILYDCHSIRSEIPHLFQGRLPDFNIGDNDGTTCDPAITRAAEAACAAAPDTTQVVNGRFKGGWTTRHYGRPHEQVHAIQMELSQRLYLEKEERPFAYDEAKAKILRETLRTILRNIEHTANILKRAETPA